MEQLADAVAETESLRPGVYVRRDVRRAGVLCALLMADTAMLLAATMLATYVRFETFTVYAAFDRVVPQLSYYVIALIVTALWVAVLAFERLYDLDRLFWGSGEFTGVVRALSLGVVAFIIATFGLKMPGLSRAWTLLAWLFAVILVCADRLCIRTAMHVLRRRGRLLRPTLIVGSNAEAKDLIRVLRRRNEAGLVPVGCVGSSHPEQLDLDYVSGDVPVLGKASALAAIVRDHRVDNVIIASSAFDHASISRMIAQLRGESVDIHISSGLFEVLTSRVLVGEVAGVPLITVKGVSLSPVKQFVKRAFDLTVASAMIVLGMPLWLLIAATIRLDSRGPVLYQQERTGRNGERFGMLKFRSMVQDADERLEALSRENEADGPLFKIKSDPRVTKIGKWLRHYSIDEFPQLLNVIRGEMSLVGPRPPLPAETHQYTDYHWRRLEVPPGMTGLWQVSGRSHLTFEEMVRLDLFYIENWSVGLDSVLLLRTIPAVLFGRGAY